MEGYPDQMRFAKVILTFYDLTEYKKEPPTGSS